MKNVFFAEYAVFYVESVHSYELVETFQEFVSTLSNWPELVAHESKTKLMIITSRIYPVLMVKNNMFYYFNNIFAYLLYIDHSLYCLYKIAQLPWLRKFDFPKKNIYLKVEMYLLLLS